MAVNQIHLKEQISELEKGIVISKIELIKLPIFNKSISAELKSSKDKVKKNEFMDMLDRNDKSKVSHLEAIVNAEQMVKEAKKLLVKPTIFNLFNLIKTW